MPKTSDGRADKPSPNLLLGAPLPAEPNQVWAGDITFIPTAFGWIYLAVVIDLCSRKIVGWALTNHMRTDLVSAAPTQALGSREAVPDLIFHSDRGSQYGSTAYREILSQARMRQSMSARANPYHNAWTESFMGTLKTEMLQDGCFLNEADARTEIFEYIDSYYHHHRKNSSFGYRSLAQFEGKIRSIVKQQTVQKSVAPHTSILAVRQKLAAIFCQPNCRAWDLRAFRFYQEIQQNLGKYRRVHFLTLTFTGEPTYARVRVLLKDFTGNHLYRSRFEIVEVVAFHPESETAGRLHLLFWSRQCRSLVEEKI